MVIFCRALSRGVCFPTLHNVEECVFILSIVLDLVTRFIFRSSLLTMDSLVFRITGNICVDYNDDFRSGDAFLFVLEIS